jgi:hypothetical protein
MVDGSKSGIFLLFATPSFTYFNLHTCRGACAHVVLYTRDMTIDQGMKKLRLKR